MFPEQYMLNPVFLTIIGGLCGLLPWYFARKLGVPEVGVLSLFICALAGFATGFAGLVPVAVGLTLSLWWFYVCLLSPEEVGATGLQASNPHHILAVFFDLHVAGAIFPPFLILCVMISLTIFMIAVGSILWLCLAFYVFLYPRFSSFRTPFCTPGETMAGCVLENGNKVWYTRFTQSRWFFFLVLWILLLYPGNAFDSIIEQAVQGNPPSLLLVLGRTLYVVAFLISVYHLSQGRFGWSLVPYCFLSIQVILSTSVPDQPFIWVIKGTNLVSLGMLTIMLAFYSHARTQECRLWPKKFQPCMAAIAGGILVGALLLSSWEFISTYWSSIVVSPQWEAYTSPEGDFRVSFPNTPLANPERQAGEVSSFSVKTLFNRVEFEVWRSTYSERIDTIGGHEEIVHWYTQKFADTLQAEAPVKLNHLEGVRLITYNPGGYFWTWQQRWVFYHDRRIYALIMRGNNPAEITIHARKFFRSFQLY